MSSVDTGVYMRPSPAQVACLVASHGMEAAAGRWHWMDERTLGSLAQAGRAAKGEMIRRAVKSRSYSEMDAAVCVEASFVLGSGTRGERAAGIGHNVTQGLFPRRGLDYVCITPEERGRAASIGTLANGGNADAIAARERRYAHELAVGQVLRAALALVPTQPEFGRYLLPPVDDALRAAVAGLCPAAVEAVFPDLAPVAAPAPAEEAAPIDVPDPAPTIEAPAVTQIPETAPELNTDAEPVRRRGKMPAEDVLRADHAAGARVADLAVTYGVSQQGIYQAWSRLGLAGRGRFVSHANVAAAQHRAAAQVAVTAPSADVPAEPVAPEPLALPRQVDPYNALSPTEAVAVVAGIQADAPLGLHDLGRAVDLADLKRLTPAVAIGWIREDIRAVAAARAARVIPPAMAYEDSVAIANEAIANEVFRELMLADDAMSTRQ